MKITYDPKVGALYIAFRDDLTICESEEVSPGLVLDYADGDQIVGIEMLEARHRLSHDQIKPIEIEYIEK